MRLLLLLFLTACSGVQGVPVPPIRTLPPAWDSPATTDTPIEIGHPGARTTPPPPRGTDKRVLPPTKEPGIWASDGAPAPSVPMVGGVELPVPWGEELTYAKWCAERLNTPLVERDHLRAWEGRLTLEQRRCVVARVYDECMARLVKHYAKAPPDTAAQRLALKRTDEEARRFRVKACRGVEQSPDDIERAFWWEMTAGLKELE